MENKDQLTPLAEKPICFVIMPISDADGYPSGHFRRVYEDIFKPACERAGYKVVRADDVYKTNFIQLDILQKLLSSDMAICDLSTRNPNVLYELGLRQAFDKPTVLLQEKGTPQIFDISPLRYTEYNRELTYREVLADQEKIFRAIIETKEAFENQEGVNSLVKLLSINSAKIKDFNESDKKELAEILLNDFTKIKKELSGYVSTINSYQNQKNNDQEIIMRFDKLEKGIEGLMQSVNNKLSKNLLNSMVNELKYDGNYLSSMPISNSFRILLNSLSSQLSELEYRISMMT